MSRAAAYCMTRNLYMDAIPSIKSLILHSDVEKIYLLVEDDDFPFERPEIQVINVSGQTIFPPNGPNYGTHFTYMAMMRAALYKYIPEDRVLSLDCDTIVCQDIFDLWRLPLDNYYLAAGREPHKTREGFLAINAGVVMQNLALLRQGKGDEIIKALNERRYDFVEQDVFNELCQGGIFELPPCYNVHAWALHPVIETKIMHYAGISLGEWANMPLVRQYRDMEVR